MQTSGLLLIVLYLVIYAGLVAAVWAWRLNRRQERPPTPEKLLRAPGESLRRKLESFDNQLLLQLLAGGLLPLLVMALGLYGLGQADPGAQTWGLIFLLLLVAGGVFMSARWLIQILDRRRNHYLGYFGERVVGERLEALRQQGYLVFHDVPALEAQPTFNLDHVVVGPTGIFAIETKTRRKGASRPGLAEHKIVAREGTLQFPWGADAHGLKSTLERARWLQEWAYQILGYQAPVVPVLTFPGWWVEDLGHGPVRVTNPQQILPLVKAGAAVLSEDQVSLLARHLEARCRDVEF